MPVTVKLIDEDVWMKFHPHTEMLVTRQGRGIFPRLGFRVTGLVPYLYYAIEIHFERVDDIKYKFHKGVWKAALKDVPRPIEKVFRHPSEWKKGEQWMKIEKIDFKSIKITTDIESTEDSHITVQSMQKYVPVLTIVQMGEPEYREQFRFNIAEFMVTTTYHNEENVRLKLKYNKYASRSGKQISRKRSASPVEQESSSSSSSNSPQDSEKCAAKRAPLPPTPLIFPTEFLQYSIEMAEYFGPLDHYWPMMPPRIVEEPLDLFDCFGNCCNF